MGAKVNILHAFLTSASGHADSALYSAESRSAVALTERLLAARAHRRVRTGTCARSPTCVGMFRDVGLGDRALGACVRAADGTFILAQGRGRWAKRRLKPRPEVGVNGELCAWRGSLR